MTDGTLLLATEPSPGDVALIVLYLWLAHGIGLGHTLADLLTARRARRTGTDRTR